MLNQKRRLHIIRDVELSNILEKLPENAKNFHKFPEEFSSQSDWNIWLELSNGELIGCDLVVESTGVIPNSKIWKRGCEQVNV